MAGKSWPDREEEKPLQSIFKKVTIGVCLEQSLAYIKNELLMDKVFDYLTKNNTIA